MITPQLVDYVRKQLAAGTSKETITKNLIQNGWSQSDVADAFTKVAPAQAMRSIRAAAPAPSHSARKIMLSAVMIVASAAYAGWVYVTGAQQPPATAPSIENQTQQTAPPQTASQVVTATPPPTQTQTSQSQTHTTQTQPAPAPAPKPQGQYVDGSYTGAPADAYYGTIQVRATVSGGKLTNVTFLQYPNDRSTSREINGVAMPQLKSEAIAAQSANVDIVSGATDSSQAFIESLGSALAQAKNS